MGLSVAVIVVGFLVSTIGFSLFLYGKKQARVPQLIVGVLLMALPFVLHNALWMAVASVTTVGGMWLAVRMGC